MQPTGSSQDRFIVALDVATAAEALAMVDLLGSSVSWYKVGLELYLAEGAAIVRTLKSRGKGVFLDLKLHDIPNTVAAATRIAAATGADLLTLHATGGPAMLDAGVVAAAASGCGLRLLAVTVLTSMDAYQLSAAGVPDTPGNQVSRLGAMALGSGVHGLVCSPMETASLRSLHGNGPLLVVPGIRSAADAAGDQSRTADAAAAMRAGASMLVVGRPVTRSKDPVQAVQRILRQIEASAA